MEDPEIERGRCEDVLLQGERQNDFHLQTETDSSS